MREVSVQALQELKQREVLKTLMVWLGSAGPPSSSNQCKVITASTCMRVPIREWLLLSGMLVRFVSAVSCCC
jgi:hypothetical protein